MKTTHKHLIAMAMVAGFAAGSTLLTGCTTAQTTKVQGDLNKFNKDVATVEGDVPAAEADIAKAQAAVQTAVTTGTSIGVNSGIKAP